MLLKSVSDIPIHTILVFLMLYLEGLLRPPHSPFATNETQR